MASSVGVGLSNERNLRSPPWHRPDMVIERLSLPDIQWVCERTPVKLMNLRAGENDLHPDYYAIPDYSASLGVVTSITANGLSTDMLTDAELTRFRSDDGSGEGQGRRPSEGGICLHDLCLAPVS
jgi:hypothetical protein